MTIPNTGKPLPIPLGSRPLNLVRRYLSGRNALLAAATLAIVVGMAFNWRWLVTAGIAPLLLSALPCVAMCALGLCMNRKSGRSCEAKPSSGAAPDTRPQSPASSQVFSSSFGLPENSTAHSPMKPLERP